MASACCTSWAVAPISHCAHGARRFIALNGVVTAGGGGGVQLYPIVRHRNLPTYSTSDEDSFLFDHDLNSYAYFDVGGVPVPQHVVDRVAKAFQAVVDKIAEQVERMAPDAQDVPLSSIMAKTLEAMTEVCCQTLSIKPDRCVAVESRLSWTVCARVCGWASASGHANSLRRLHCRVANAVLVPSAVRACVISVVVAMRHGRVSCGRAWLRAHGSVRTEACWTAVLSGLWISPVGACVPTC